MARTSTGNVFTDVPDANTFDDLRSDMVTNLTSWTVGPAYKFGTGSLEHGYFTLSHDTTSAEILIGVGIGQYSTYHLAVEASRLYPHLGNPTFSWRIAFAPAGGFEAALVASHNPATTAFVNHITSTLSLREPTHIMTNRCMYWGSPSLDFTYIEDDTTDMFAMYCWRTAGVGGHFLDQHIMGSDLLINTKSDGDHYRNFMISHWGLNSGTPRDKSLHYGQAWLISDGSLRVSADVWPFFYSQVAESDIGTQSSFSTSKVALMHAPIRGKFTAYSSESLDRYIGHIDPDVMLAFPRVNNRVTAFGSLVTKKFIQLHDGIAMPWADNLADPTF